MCIHFDGQGTVKYGFGMQLVLYSLFYGLLLCVSAALSSIVVFILHIYPQK